MEVLDKKEFSVSITSHIVDRSSIGAGQCFPLFWYEENKNTQSSLFDDAETNRYIRHDGITDWILKEVHNRFGGSRAITKEHIFYYVYGLLHSKQYRERFADDLKNHCHAFLLLITYRTSWPFIKPERTCRLTFEL